jgi:2',3'-cyclic-nucleotide 2'-phosphodiesterase (5'-nucleotidase family)
VDDANTRDPNRLTESAMGSLVTDAMRAKYPEAEAAITNSGGLRADLTGSTTLAIAYITANSPVAPVTEGRWLKTG